MDAVSALVYALIILLAIIFCGSFGWYHYSGWATFAYKTKDSPSWKAAKDQDISRLRFKDCVFTVRLPTGKVVAQNVDPALNSMAVAYKSGTRNPLALTLTRPLNPFSFTIPGFNDKAAVQDPTVYPWCIDCPNGAAGATVTLTGKVRTI
jgi:hypothetical protein